jgi:hypothetical protein
MKDQTAVNWPHYRTNAVNSLIMDACGYCSVCQFYMSGALCSAKHPHLPTLAEIDRAIATLATKGDSL